MVFGRALRWRRLLAGVCVALLGSGCGTAASGSDGSDASVHDVSDAAAVGHDGAAPPTDTAADGGFIAGADGDAAADTDAGASADAGCRIDDDCPAGDGVCELPRCRPDGSCGFFGLCECTTDADCTAYDNNDACDGVPFCDADATPRVCRAKPGSAVLCPTSDDTFCAAQACDPATASCTKKPRNPAALCDDGDSCTLNTVCTDGACAGGVPLCSCKTTSDCASYDTNLCAGVHYCDHSTAWPHCRLNGATAVHCSTANDTACAKNGCDASTGTCKLSIAATGTACDDGDACTGGDACEDGACDAGAVNTCVCKSNLDCASEEAGTGWDNWTFRLGVDLAVRLPRRTGAIELLRNERRWLPELAPRLPLPTPVPIAFGAPDVGFAAPWSVVRWVAGTPVDEEPLAADQGPKFAEFLGALHQPAPPDAPQNPFRGLPLASRREGLERCLHRLRTTTDAITANIDRMWQDALAAEPFHHAPVWLHGDLHGQNVLGEAGALVGIIDWGDLCSGDPAVDLGAVWGLLDDPRARAAAVAAYAPDATLLARAKGWAVLFGAALYDNGRVDDPRHAALGRAILRRLHHDGGG